MGTCGFQKVVTSKNYIEQEGKGGLDELSTAVINHSYSWYGTLLDGLLVALGCKAPFTYAVIVHAKKSPVHSSGHEHRPVTVKLTWWPGSGREIIAQEIQIITQDAQDG